MGIFEFFKVKKSVSESKKIEFIGINDFITKEKQKIIEDETKSINIIKNNIKSLAIEFEGEILTLNKIDLNDGKIGEKFKFIVLENAKIFASYLEKLKDKIENLHSHRLADLINEIDINFQEFRKKSFMSHEKANIFIGKELGAVQKTIDSFYKNINEILKENKKLIESSGIIEKSESLCREIEEIKEIKNKIQADSENINKIVNELKKQKENLEKNIIQIKESKEYSQKLKRNQEFEAEKNELKKEFINLRNLINFKELAKIHHSIPKNMKIIKEYSDNIQDAFEKDKGKFILELAGKNKKEISEKINKILEKEKKISEFIPEKDDVLEIQEEISIINNKIIEEEEEKAKLEKKISTFENKISSMKEQLAQEFEKIGFKLE